MEPLDILVEEEKKARERQPETVAEEMLPYLKHNPFAKWLSDQGRLIRYQSLPSPPLLAAVEGGENKLAQAWQKICQQRDIEVAQAVERMQRQYGAVIPEDVLKSYMLQLAGRILDYANRHLRGLQIETPTHADIALELARPEVTISEIVKRAKEGVTNPDIVVRETIANVSLYYHQHTL
ncbi:hypothetical protein HYV85_00140 [Candidatus Woesearchaeota archaeon]|nr:hypothetical protein [Candidatus Woesearchaeota archaeon]